MSDSRAEDWDPLGHARRAASFIRNTLWDHASGTLLRRYRGGDARVEGYAEDYAYLIFGLLELFQADGDPAWLEWALALQDRQDALFWDPVDGGWFSTTGADPSVLLRLKEDYDGAEPAATSISVLNLLIISHLAGGNRSTRALEKIERTFGAFATRAAQMGRAVPMMLSALSIYHAGVPQLVIVGERDAEDTMALRRILKGTYMPAAIVIPVVAAHRDALAQVLPWTESMIAVEGRAAAYVCRDFTCQMPTTSPDELASQLRDGAS